jgi:hypothetical protein
MATADANSATPIVPDDIMVMPTLRPVVPATTIAPDAAVLIATNPSASGSDTDAVANTVASAAAAQNDALPDDVCKAKAHYVSHNRSLKVLVAMAWGLLNEDGSPLFDETIEPWKDLKGTEWRSDRKELAVEIRRRWEDYIKPSISDPDAVGPRPAGWAKTVQLDWLVSHPISQLGNDFTTQCRC